jgi:folate-binding protein YgfZ
MLPLEAENLSKSMLTIQSTIQTDYLALRDSAALQQRPNAGVLVLTDADRSDFLHRMTTNNINALKPGQSAVTVLTSPTARIVFVFTVICRPDALWILPAPGETAALSRYLRGQIFFMDKVKVQDASAQLSRLRVMGPLAAEKLAEAGLALPQAADGAWLEADDIVVVQQLGYELPGYELIVPAAQVEGMVAQLSACGVATLADDAAYQARRIELGRSLPGQELTGEYNPLEAGLAWSCADNKGCYTGQEIIARQITYDKVTKTLVGVRSNALLTRGVELLAEGRAVGTITSAAYSPTLAAPLALAVVKRPYNEVGQVLQAGETVVEVAKLPFV